LDEVAVSAPQAVEALPEPVTTPEPPKPEAPAFIPPGMVPPPPVTEAAQSAAEAPAFIPPEVVLQRRL
jgi:sec-independent protein translocase protein TatB